jgi:hypothetical protein
MRTLCVVVPHILLEHTVEMSPPPDQRVIEAIGAHGTHPRLGEGVGLRSPKGVRMTSRPHRRKSVAEIAIPSPIVLEPDFDRCNEAP